MLPHIFNSKMALNTLYDWDWNKARLLTIKAANQIFIAHSASILLSTSLPFFSYRYKLFRLCRGSELELLISIRQVPKMISKKDILRWGFFFLLEGRKAGFILVESFKSQITISPPHCSTIKKFHYCGGVVCLKKSRLVMFPCINSYTFLSSKVR